MVEIICEDSGAYGQHALCPIGRPTHAGTGQTRFELLDAAFDGT